jgi:hypothetical protein
LSRRIISGIILTMFLTGMLPLGQASSGGNIDVYTQNGGEGPNVSSGSFMVGEEVILFALVTYNDWPEQNNPVCFDVYDPEGESYCGNALYGIYTDSTGVASTSFIIPMPDSYPNVLGIWSVTVSANIPLGEEQEHYEDTVTFEVRTLEVISWEYIFEDTRRETMLKISTDDKYFQFIASDETFSVKYDPDMLVGKHVTIICFKDDEIRLVTLAINTQIDFCFAYAKDMKTGKYLLIDRSGIE